MTHTFDLYREYFQDTIQKLKSQLPPMVVVEREIQLITLPEGEIIWDIETTGLKVSDEIIAYGIARKNTVKIVCRVGASEEELLEVLKKDLEGVKKIWAWNNGFEKKYLQDRLPDLYPQYEWGELQPRPYEKLMHYVEWNWGDPFDGSVIPQLWENWQNRLSFGSLAGIIHHCYADIMREVTVFWLMKNGAIPPREEHEEHEEDWE